MRRDAMTRSWGPLSCRSSATITSCCSMIMHSHNLQGSVHNSWKLKTSPFLHGLHTHQTCHPLSMFGMLWIGVYNNVFQFLPISSNFTLPLKRSGPTFHRPQSTTWSTLCKGDVSHCMRQMVVTPDSEILTFLTVTIRAGRANLSLSATQEKLLIHQKLFIVPPNPEISFDMTFWVTVVLCYDWTGNERVYTRN